MVIAIDGPAASGKSSTARWVAERLGYLHVDSGSLYRAATAAALGRASHVDAWTAGFVLGAARRHNVVVDGRDIGTVVFPDADLKVFLVADPWERARRRLLQRLGRRPSDEEIAEETGRLVHRDARDATQTLQAPDAVLIDTTYLTQEEQVERIVALARAVTQRDAATSL